MMDRSKIGSALFISVLMVGCGGGDGGGDGAATDSGGESGAAAAPAAPAVDPAIAATIAGRIVFEGQPPVAEAIDMSEEPVCADKYTETPSREGVMVTEGGLNNVFVYVKEGVSGGFPAPAEAVEIDQLGCRYQPHVIGVQAGQSLVIRNSDAVLHNINTQPTVNRGFNISQPQEGMETTREFSRAEVMIPVKCDVHGWMSAYIGVLDHPYHDVSSGAGEFVLSGLAPGTYTIEAWHEVYGTATQEITVGDAEMAEITFNFGPDQAAEADVPMADPIMLTHAGSDASHAGH
jgi:hypothetical protein